jgi:hypothetical protein
MEYISINGRGGVVEISNNNFIPRKNNKMKKMDDAPLKKKEDGTASAIDSGDYINETGFQYNEVTSRVQRSITKDQVILAGLETIRSFIESGMSREESIPFLHEIVEKTQFDNEKVLESHTEEIVRALEEGNKAAIEELIHTTREDIDSLTEELEMNELKKQNLRSLKHLSREDNPEELMHKVITSLKKEGLPEMNIPRQRITDLLGD